MNLNDLEYKPEDFFKVRPMYPDEDTCDWAARVANQLLRERLERAQPVFGTARGRSPIGTLYYPDLWTTCQRAYFDTHVGRLVCIEQVKP